ncbi:tetratricopeptide repeat protein [Deinococcus taklimakanensis]|uniref:Tetratricopeptide repeat protein n=1 Tax=Deinococcus taklimakanensis TaxID=536443 RepID=A0ABW5P190_9DEIO
MRKPLILTATLILTALGAAGAQSLQSASAQLKSGKWQEAATAAAALNTADGYALAAEATTQGASVSADGQKKAMFQKAQDYAKKAIELNPNSAEAYFELARAQGRMAQYAGIMESLGIAKDMKRNLDKAISLNPKLAGAYVALGLWNANLNSKGFIATSATGANKNDVVPNFKKALALEPNNPTHRLEYVNAMLLLNASANKSFAVSQLQAAVAMPATDFWQKRDQDQAKALLAKLK